MRKSPLSTDLKETRSGEVISVAWSQSTMSEHTNVGFCPLAVGSPVAPVWSDTRNIPLWAPSTTPLMQPERDIKGEALG
jgi:hypothetical protein